jgi:hypothetical protein
MLAEGPVIPTEITNGLLHFHKVHSKILPQNADNQTDLIKKGTECGERIQPRTGSEHGLLCVYQYTY